MAYKYYVYTYQVWYLRVVSMVFTGRKYGVYEVVSIVFTGRNYGVYES
ncbi:MAG: hypothetical protein MR017_04190 [Paraprevotella sp.]|nr:hypothetical protein [Paraprevotella sp.]